MIKLLLLVLMAWCAPALDALKLEFNELWKKESYCMRALNQKDGIEAGHAFFWVLSDWVAGTREGYLQELEVRLNYQGQGMGHYLFSSALNWLHEEGVVTTTRWWAYPLWQPIGSTRYKELLPRLVSFYEELGGIIDKDNPPSAAEGGVNFYFDHNNRKAIAACKRIARKKRKNCVIQLPEEERRSCYAAQVGVAVTARRWKPLCEVRYEDEGDTRTITAIKLFEGGREALVELAPFLVDNLEMPLRSVKQALKKAEERIVLPGLREF